MIHPIFDRAACACRTRIGTALALVSMASGLLCGGTPASAADLNELSKGIVKLYVTQQGWDFDQPWAKRKVARGVCTGFLIKEGILTNAHCVTETTFLQLEIPGLADKVEVERVAVSHDLDLALLRLKDPKDLPEKLPMIHFGDLPKLREKVVTVGYPIGGRQVSYTEGVVSRIDIMNYAYSRVANLMVQTDAAINPGNSGGPVFSDETGNCIGVATQTSNAQSIGYFIPVPVVEQFLHDWKDGKIEGVPALGVYMQDLENPSLREYLGMTPDQSGVRILRVARDGSAHGIFKVNDVVLTIDGNNILNDGQVPFRDHGKIGLTYYVATRQVGDTIKFTVLREGKVLDLKMRLKSDEFMVIPRTPLYDRPPAYYEIGGLVFRSIEPRNLDKNTPVGVKIYLDDMRGEDGGLDELVVISDVYEADVNKGYDNAYVDTRVTQVNGKPIKRLKDVADAIEANKGARYQVIELANRQLVVLDQKLIEREEKTLRERYDIR